MPGLRITTECRHTLCFVNQDLTMFDVTLACRYVLWSSLGMEDSQALHVLATTALLPAVTAHSAFSLGRRISSAYSSRSTPPPPPSPPSPPPTPTCMHTHSRTHAHQNHPTMHMCRLSSCMPAAGVGEACLAVHDLAALLCSSPLAAILSSVATL